MIERTVLANLIFNEEYTRKTIPFIDPEYFDDYDERLLFNEIKSYMDDYNGLPTKEALNIAISEKDNINEDQYGKLTNLIADLQYDPANDLDWLIDKTEKFCQDKAIYNAVKKSILVLDGRDDQNDKGSIPQMLSDALGVSFDGNIGHDFLEHSQERYEFYHAKEDKIEFDMEYFNDITKGGLSRKSLSIALAGTGVGKTLFMTHCASANLMAGLNVLYITMEMAEERIAERIDANLLDVTLDDLKVLPRDVYNSRIGRVKTRTTGKLVVKEYPTASAGSAHFRHLLNELKLKKNFTPDVIYIDYLNICMSSRLKYSANVNSYTLVKSIAEELRGLAVEYNVPIMSATQTTRTGYTSSDVGLEDTSESFGLPATADFMFALISTEELEELGQLMVKQLKNRWGDVSNPKRFIVGIDRAKMRLFDAEASAQQGLLDGKPQSKPKDTSVMDDTVFGSRLEDEFSGKHRKRNFEGIV